MGLTKKLSKKHSTLEESPAFKVTLLGAGCVGKSSLITRLMRDEFTESHEPTVSEDYHWTFPRHSKPPVKLLLHDTAGSIEFPVMRRLAISKSQACMVLYSVESHKSLELAKLLIEEVIQVCGEQFPCVLVGNKCDLDEREVSFEKGLRCAVQYGCSYLETSVKEGKNINEAFDSVFAKIDSVAQKEAVAKRRLTETISQSSPKPTWRVPLKHFKRHSTSVNTAF